MSPHPARRLFTGLVVLAGLARPLAAADAAPDPTLETYTLPKLEVGTHLVCSFGIGIIGTWDSKTEHVARVFITEVNRGSTAERLGLQRGDEILSINGKKIAEMKGGNKPGSDLFNLLVDRPPGEIIEVEVAVRVVRKVSLPAAKLGVPGPLKPAAEMTARPSG